MKDPTLELFIEDLNKDIEKVPVSVVSLKFTNLPTEKMLTAVDNEGKYVTFSTLVGLVLDDIMDLLDIQGYVYIDFIENNLEIYRLKADGEMVLYYRKVLE